MDMECSAAQGAKQQDITNCQGERFWRSLMSLEVGLLMKKTPFKFTE